MKDSASNLIDMMIDEISLVDKGANPEAHVAFFKREQTPFSPDDAVGSIGNVENPKRREWASFANAAYRSQLEAGKSEAEAKRIARQTANEQFEKGVSKMDIEELKKALEDAHTQNQELTTLANMSDMEKAFMDKMGDDDKKRFMNLSKEDRMKEMEKAGMKKLAKEDVQKQLDDIEKRLSEKDDVIAKQSESIEKMQEENEMLKLQKRAEKELDGISGDVEKKAKLLKALESIEDEDVRKMAFENIKKSASAGEAFCKSQGDEGTGSDNPNDILEKRAVDMAADEKITKQQAYAKLMASPEGAKLYNAAKKGA